MKKADETMTLRLSRETLRELTSDELRRIAGGPSGTVNCWG